MIKTKILAVFAVLVCSYYSFGQNPNGSSGPHESNTANASKGGAGGQLTNVDLYTGTASVHVPIHEFGLEGLNAGVSLNYTAKGVRVDELSSSIGLGWQLSAGGSIVREVNGIEDEISLPAYFKAGAVTYPSHDSGTFDWMEGSLAYKANAHVNVPGYEFNKDESDCDLFHVSMLGRSFSFAMRRNPSLDPFGHDNIVAFVKPHNSLKIEVESEFWNSSLTTLLYTAQGIPESRAGWNEYEGILRFKITDEKGNVFHFRRGDYQKKKYNLNNLYNNAEGTYYATTKWNLVQVNTITGQTINFEYEQAPIKYLENVTETLYEVYNKPPILDLIDSVAIYDPLEIKEIFWEGVKSHIKKITYPNGTIVNFIIDNDTAGLNMARLDCPGDWIIDKIEVQQGYNAKNTRKLVFDLKHAYFNTPAYGETAIEVPYTKLIGAATYNLSISGPYEDSLREKHRIRGMRLKLTGINRIGFDNTTTRKYYDFGYMDIALPYRFSPHKDYFGFYNGKSPAPHIRQNFFWTGSNNFPQYDTFYLSIPYHFDRDYAYRAGLAGGYASNVNPYWGLDRSHDTIFSQACVLNEIINAYGGKEILQFQSYSLTNPTCGYGYSDKPKCPANDYIGCDIDPNTQGSTVNDGLVIGEITMINGYSGHYNYTTRYTFENGERFYQGGYTWYNISPTDTVRTNYYTCPRDYYNGSNHGFSNVTVRKYGMMGTELLSDSRYKFSNLMFYDPTYPYNGHMRSNLNKVSGYDYKNLPGHMNKHRMGLLQESEEYDAHGKLVSRHENVYTEVYDPSPYASTHWVLLVNYARSVCYYQNEESVNSARYIIDDKRMLKTSETFKRRLNVMGSANFTDMQVTYNYYYDTFDNITLITWSDSELDNYKKYRRYNYNWPSNLGSSAINDMNDDHLQYVISQEVWKMSGTMDSTLLDMKLTAPRYVGILQFPVVFSLVNNETLPSATAGTLIGSGTTAIKLKNALDYENSSDYGTKILKNKEYTILSTSGDVLEHRLNDQDIYVSTIYESYGRKSAAALNARYKDIAFTSFEVSKGRWNYNIADTVHIGSNAMTGSHAFNLIKDNNNITGFAMDTMDYALAFWAKGTTVPVVELVKSSGTQSVTMLQANTVGDWKLYTSTFTAEAGDYIRIKNGTLAPMLIDEIRLHPAAATFETYTNVPMCGPGSKSDNTNYITYYEYDQLGRMVITRDMRGNILTKLEQFAMDPDNGSISGSGGTPGGSGSY